MGEEDILSTALPWYETSLNIFPLVRTTNDVSVTVSISELREHTRLLYFYTAPTKWQIPHINLT
jgi:hypothetical protein